MEERGGSSLYYKRLKEIKEMNLTSDLFSSVVFEDVQAVQDVLKILTGIQDIHVIQVIPQNSKRNLYGHGVVLDIWAEDSSGRQYTMEIQMSENEDHLRRSRFIQSLIDSRGFAAGQEYEELPELYMIFITQKDFLHVKTGIKKVVRVIEGTNRKVDNGVHEVFVNLQYPAENDEVNDLLQYIKDTKEVVSSESFIHLVQRVNYLKNEPGGVQYMCKTMERERAEGRIEGDLFRLIKVVMNMRKKGMNIFEIADLLDEDQNNIETILFSADEVKSEDIQVVYQYLIKRL